MAVQYSNDLRHAQLDQIEAVLGASALLVIYAGAVPANVAAAEGTILATLTLPADWMLAAGTGPGGVGKKEINGPWTGSASGTGTATYFRLKTSGGVAKVQGSVSAVGGTGDLKVDNVSFTASQSFTVSQFTVNAANA